MRIIRGQEQKDNLAKYCWDLFKITLAALVIAPLARPEAVDLRGAILGFSVGVLFAVFGYILDGMELRL